MGFLLVLGYSGSISAPVGVCISSLDSTGSPDALGISSWSLSPTSCKSISESLVIGAEAEVYSMTVS